MSQHDFDRLLQKYLLGECSPAEEGRVLGWYKNLIQKSSLEISDAEKEMIQRRIWSKMNIGDAIEQVPPVPATKYKYLSIFYRIAIAASVLLFVTVGVYFLATSSVSKPVFVTTESIPDNYISLTNKNETVQLVTLTDGSVVHLNPKATLSYPAVFTGALREVYLNGDAFFKVYRNPAKHFRVVSAGLVTEVLGTSFHIRQDQPGSRVEISVVTGKVSVYEKVIPGSKGEDSIGAGRVVLTPNQKCTYNANNSQFVTSLVAEPALLEEYDKAGIANFNFDNAPLSRVFKDLQEAYGIEISTAIKSMENCHFTGDISKQDLYKKLEIICQSFQTSYEVKGTQIIIKGMGCK